MSKCRSCGAPIKWIETVAGKKMPVDPDPFELNEAEPGDICITERGVTMKYDPAVHGADDREVYVSHFATCKHADEWRKK